MSFVKGCGVEENAPKFFCDHHTKVTLQLLKMQNSLWFLSNTAEENKRRVGHETRWIPLSLLFFENLPTWAVWFSV
jgi:hypothetical protein